MALGLVFFGAHFARFIYQHLSLLILAYVILFLPAAVGSARTSLLQVNPRVEEAARSLGRAPLQVFASVTLPLVRPGILAGAALVFLLTMKELPATLILRPIGFPTLATSIWSAASEAFFAQGRRPGPAADSGILGAPGLPDAAGAAGLTYIDEPDIQDVFIPLSCRSGLSGLS